MKGLTFNPFRRIIFLILFSYFSMPCSLFSQSPNYKIYKEITLCDITEAGKITAHDISVFNIHLGMTISEVKSLLQNNPRIYLMIDPYIPLRYYIYDKYATGENKTPLVYLIWDEKSLILKEITMYQEFSKYTVGKTNLLFTQDVFNKESEICKTFLGLPYKKKMLLDIPSIQLKSYAYYYYRNFVITKNISDGISIFYFSILLKPE